MCRALLLPSFRFSKGAEFSRNDTLGWGPDLAWQLDADEVLMDGVYGVRTEDHYTYLAAGGNGNKNLGTGAFV